VPRQVRVRHGRIYGALRLWFGAGESAVGGVPHGFPMGRDLRFGSTAMLYGGGSGFDMGYAATGPASTWATPRQAGGRSRIAYSVLRIWRRGDILDEGWLKSMKELEWRRKIGGCGAAPSLTLVRHFAPFTLS